MLVLGACSSGGGDEPPEGLGLGPFVLDVQVGDCFEQPRSPDDAGVTVVECNAPHDFEVFARFTVEGQDFPGRGGVREMARAGCEERFEAYVGSAPEDSGLVIVSVAPTGGQWRNGERDAICSASVAGGGLDSSVQGSEAPTE